MEICYVPSLFVCNTRMLLLLVYLNLLFIPSVFGRVQLSNRSNPHLSNVSDQDAMLGFVSALTTYNPSQSLPTNWKRYVSVCEWTSINCSESKVVFLNASSMGLEGTISPLLGNLSFLTRLDLRNNNFHGHIPYQLGSLFHLKWLLLSGNHLQGSIPPTLAGCRSLTHFSISANTLTGNIPPELCVLPNLQFIDLASNILTGAIPACLGNITSLVDITLNHNHLHGRVPFELGMLSHLSRFFVWNNSLTGKIPSSFSNCTNLRELNLASNNLTGPIPTELCTRHTQLIGLYMFGNQLNGSIPAALFNCTKLQVIELGTNQLSGVVPMELGKLTHLKRLFLHQNRLISGSTTSLPILSTLTNCSSLEIIDFFSNHLTGCLSSSIGQLSKHMDMIYLGENELAGEIPPQIGNLTSLSFLGLEKNHFTGAIPSSLKKLQKLQRLYLPLNNLQGNIPTEIGEVKSLGLLNLWGNNLSGRIPDSLGLLQQLNILILRSNKLSGNIPANLGNCVNLLELDLSYNRLSGRIPQVGGLANLARYLRLSNNLLQGPVPLELSKMTKVLEIDISANQLTGNIPSALGNCIALEHLILCCNALEGPIPDSISELQYLQEIDFSSNNLSGEIPLSLEKLKMLSHVNFSFNNLSGEVPNGGIFKNISATAFMGNAGLCGNCASLPPCSTSEHKSLLHSKRVIIFVGAVTTTVVSCLFLGILWRRNHRRLAVAGSLKVVSCLFLGILWRRNHRKPATAGSLKVGHQRISYGEIINATDEFSDSNLLGVGSFGKVYKGVMSNGTIVAIKILNLENEGANKSFDRECNVLSRVRHRNLMKIITSYSDMDFKALIFPFMPNGSLEKWLYPNGEKDSSVLSLIQRLNIAIDIAHGMAYLHHHCFMQVIHCDLKPNNVLLGEDLTAYVIDFGIATIYFADSKESALTSTYVLKGSTGYIPPEYGLEGRVTAKGDVYSYGMVLLEMLTRKKPTNSLFIEGMDLKKWVSIGFPHQLEEVVDNSLLRNTNTSSTEEDKEFKCLSQLIRLGLVCTEQSPQKRPNMIDIVGTLQNIRDSYLGATPKSISNQISYGRLLGSPCTNGNNADTSTADSQSSTF